MMLVKNWSQLLLVWVACTAALGAFGCDGDDSEDSAGTDGETDTQTDSESSSPVATDEDTGTGSASDNDTGKSTGSDSETGDTQSECQEADKYWVYDLSHMPPSYIQLCAHVRGEGETVHVLVADDAWESSVDAGMVATLIAAWDESTPADPSRGIFEIVSEAFGEPPDVFDNDPKIWLFLYEMEPFGSYAFDGYFMTEDQLEGSTSNRHEMLHINSLLNPPDGEYSLSVQAHEFQHLIHFGKDQNEALWLNEAMSELAMVLTGFGADDDWVSSWLDQPSDPVMGDCPDCNYGVLLLLGDYLFERFGAEFVSDLVADPDNGVASLEGRFAELDPPMSLSELLGDFGLALAVNDPTAADGEFAFELIDIDSPRAVPLTTTKASTVTVHGNGGLSFVSSTVGTDGLTLRLETTAPDVLQVRAAYVGTAGTTVLDATLTAQTTDVALGVWPEGAKLWVTAANATIGDASLTVSLND